MGERTVDIIKLWVLRENTGNTLIPCVSLYATSEACLCITFRFTADDYAVNRKSWELGGYFSYCKLFCGLNNYFKIGLGERLHVNCVTQIVYFFGFQQFQAVLQFVVQDKEKNWRLWLLLQR